MRCACNPALTQHASCSTSLLATQQHLPPLPHSHRDHGPRGDRQKTRLIWLAEELGFPAFKDLIQQYMGEGAVLAGAVHVSGWCGWCGWPGCRQAERHAAAAVS